MSRFFVTLNHPNGGVVPLMEHDEHGNESVATFLTYLEAMKAIKDNMLGTAYGGRIYDTDNDGSDA